MAAAQRDIAEHDVAKLLEPTGNWAVGTEGTAVSIYENAVLVDLSHLPMKDQVDNLVTWPADKVKILWRVADHTSRGADA